MTTAGIICLTIGIVLLVLRLGTSYGEQVITRRGTRHEHDWDAVRVGNAFLFHGGSIFIIIGLLLVTL